MAVSNDFLLFADPNYAGLDKSPMLFWAAALSIKVFGATTFAFKLPILLLTLLSIYATFQLARMLYGINTARLSALVLATCQGYFLGACHAGAELMLAGWIITAIWCFRAFAVKQRWYFLLGGAVAVACGILTKGLIALFIPMAAFAMDWILRRKWQKLFSPLHLLTLLFIFLLLIPAAIGFYQRSGLHAQEWLTTNTDNAAFEYLSGTSPAATEISDSSWTARFSFLPIAIATFLPWSLLLLAAIFLNIKILIKRKFLLRRGREFVSTGGLIVSFILIYFPFSLPVSYLIIALPLSAIITGRLLRHLLLTDKYPSLTKTFTGIQTMIAAFLLLAAIAIPTLIFNTNKLVFILWIIAFLIWLIISVRNKKADRLLWTSVTSALLANVFFISFFYTPLREYDAGCMAGRYIRQHNIPVDKVFSYRMSAPLYSFDFYAQMTIAATATLQDKSKGTYLLLMDVDLPQLLALHQSYEIVMVGQLYQGKWWQPEFFNHDTRSLVTIPWSLVYLE